VLLMKSYVWSFLAGFLVVVAAFIAVSAVVMDGLDDHPIPGWLSESGDE
jgi:hypothetical protein